MHVRHPNNFRHSETKRLLNNAHASESVAVIGMSGVGKSNLYRHLQRPDIQALFLGENAKKLVIIRVNFHDAIDTALQSLNSLMLSQILSAEQRLKAVGVSDTSIGRIQTNHDFHHQAGLTQLGSQAKFRDAMRNLMATPNLRIIFLFDQFDDILAEAPPTFFVNLRGLREEFVYRLSYILFTRNAPSLIAPTVDEKRDEFLELFEHNQMGLKPYGQSDAASTLVRIAKRNRTKITSQDAVKLFNLSGGHGGLLRALYLGHVQNDITLPPDTDNLAPMDELLDRSGVFSECEKIWASLPEREKCAIKRLLQNNRPIQSPKINQHLQLKGVLKNGLYPKLFSPLFQVFVLGLT